MPDRTATGTACAEVAGRDFNGIPFEERVDFGRQGHRCHVRYDGSIIIDVMNDSIDLDVVGTKEAAALVGVQPSNFVRDWAGRPDFPKPVVRLGRRRLWDREAVRDYHRRVGPRRAQRLDDLGLSEDAERWLSIIKRRIVRRFHPERIILFGSQARGDAQADSDIDLLVVVPEEIDRHGLVEAIRTELADIAVAKDVSVTTPAHIERYGDVIGTLLEPALREGVAIYVRS